VKAIAAASALCLSIAIPVSATGAARTFVSFAGLDTNPCSRTSPCRSFTAALAQTARGGTIVALDSAGYGTITIGQSVSIVAPEGVYAGISATSGEAITIAATTNADIIHLRGLSIEGSGSGSDGIFLNQGSLKELHVDHCVITGFVGTALFYWTTGNTISNLFVSDSTFSDANYGLFAYSENVASAPHVSVDHCRFNANTNTGFDMQGAAIGTITNSVVSGNLTGIFADLGAVAIADHCQVTYNGLGVSAFEGSTIYLSNSTVSGNETGILADNSTLKSMIRDGTYPLKTNVVAGNESNGAFTGTFTAQ